VLCKATVPRCHSHANFGELRVAQAAELQISGLKLDRRRGVELALKFPLVLNRLVVGCERPRLLVRGPV